MEGNIDLARVESLPHDTTMRELESRAVSGAGVEAFGEAGNGEVQGLGSRFD